MKNIIPLIIGLSAAIIVSFFALYYYALIIYFGISSNVENIQYINLTILYCGILILFSILINIKNKNKIEKKYLFFNFVSNVATFFLQDNYCGKISQIIILMYICLFILSSTIILFYYLDSIRKKNCKL